ncbi:MAG: tetratricopeptide repeat protein, partial [Nitrospirota bacterium]
LLLEHPEPGMPTLQEELFEKVTAMSPDSPTVKKLTALMHGTSVDEAPVPARSETAVPPTVAIPSNSIQADTLLTANAAPDDPWPVTPKITSRQDRHFSVAEPEPASAQSETSQLTELEPVAPSTEFSWSNAQPDELWTSRAQETDSADPVEPVLSTSEQFQTYMKAGQQTEAEEWLSCLVTAQPDHAEARELFGSLLEAKGDTAGAAVQYSRALELLLADPEKNEKKTQPAGLYAKVKELAPASPLVAKWASTFSPKPQVPVPTVKTPVAVQSEKEIDPETHYTLGVAYKNMGLPDEAKEEFSLSMRSHDFFSDSCLMIAVCLKEQGECRSASAQLELLLKDPKCQGAKAQAIRYELGLLYEAQEQWSQAIAIYQSIPTFHDVPQRLESARARKAPAEPTPAFRYGN